MDNSKQVPTLKYTKPISQNLPHSSPVLITGGAGFIGSNLVRFLLHHGYYLTVLDNFSSGNSDYLKGLQLDIVKGDILDRDLMINLLAKQSAVVHLAAQTGVPNSVVNPFSDCHQNVLGTLTVLDACRVAGTPRFILASSNAPLGNHSPPATEDKVPRPLSPYGASKLAAEAYCSAYNGSWGLNTTILRFSNVYGPFSSHKTSVVAKFMGDILSSGRITVDGDGTQTRDFLYVEDLCRAVKSALETNITGELYQIGSGLETSVRSLVNMLSEVTNLPFTLDYKPSRQGDINQNYSDPTHASELLDWSPIWTLDAGLQKTWDWFNSTD